MYAYQAIAKPVSITANGAHFTQSGTSCMWWISSSLNATLPRQNSPEPSLMKVWLKANPAKTAPRLSTPSGNSMVNGLSCGW